MTNTGNRDRNRHGVPGFIISGGPEHFTCLSVKGRDTGSAAATQVQQNAFALHQRRADLTKESFIRSEFLARVHAPEALAGGEVQALEHTFGAECVNFPERDGRRATRPFVEPEVIAIVGGIFRRPDGTARVCIEAIRHRPVLQTMENDETPSSHHRPTETLADVFLPNLRWLPPG